MTLSFLRCRFRWVYCQVEYICGCIPARIRNALAELPDTLDETYERTLREINKAEWEFAHRLFQFVAVAYRPLRVEELAELLAFDFKAGPIPKFHEDWRMEDPVDAVLSTCTSLLIIVDGGNHFGKVIQFSHISVKEFLTSARLAKTNDIILRRYHVSMTPAHTIVAQACLGILLHLDKDVITSDTLENFLLAEYAAEHWADHARLEGVSQNVEEGMKHLFNPRKSHLDVCVWIRNPEVPTGKRGERTERPLPLTGTPLHYAALWGLHSIVQFLILVHSQDVHSRGFTDNATPLHLASKRGQMEAARMLVEHGADLTAQNKDGGTPLHLASQAGQVDVARILIECGADLTAQNKDGASPLHLASQTEQVAVVRMLIEHGGNVIAQDKDGWNPLHLALSGGRVELVRIFIEHPASEIAQGKDKWTPLCRLAFREYIDAARVFFNQDAGVTAEDRRGLTPLHLASGGHDKLALILLEHSTDTADEDFLGRTSRLASSGKIVELIRVLLERGADHVDARDNDNGTPLHWASEQGHSEVVRFLLEHGVDADARDNANCTPLHWASEQGHPEVVLLLLEHGVDADARDNDNCTPLHWASEQGHLEVVRVLIEHGIDVNAQDHSNWTPLHCASRDGRLEVVQFLLGHGANPRSSDHGGWTPLQLSSYNGHLEIVRVLLKYGADANSRDNSNWTPLHGASQQGHREVTQVLLDHGADENSRDDSNQTPLHLAPRQGQLGSVQLLAESSANTHARDDEGQDVEGRWQT